MAMPNQELLEAMNESQKLTLIRNTAPIQSINGLTTPNPTNFSKTDTLETYTKPKRTSLGSSNGVISFADNQDILITLTSSTDITTATTSGIVRQDGVVTIVGVQYVGGWATTIKFHNDTIPDLGGKSGTGLFWYSVVQGQIYMGEANTGVR